MELPGRIFDPMAATATTAAAPDGWLIYAVGDVHGRIDLLEAMQAMIVADAADRPADRRVIVYLGDYVDRGHNSKAVIERLLAGPPDGFEQVALMGNHEAWLLHFLEDPQASAGWLRNGGAATLASYGVPVSHGAFGNVRLLKAQAAFAAALPDAHRAFIADLALQWRAGDYAFVHAGVRPGVALDDQDSQDLLWIRDEFLWSDADFGAIVVHGHTIHDVPDVQANRIGVDTGAFVTGRLTCLCLEGRARRFLET